MPSAMSRPSEPVETVSISIDLSFLPSRMIEPLPKLRSICDSAASRAFDLSMDGPSTRRSAALISVLLMAGIRGVRKRRALPHWLASNGDSVHDLFFVRNMRIYPLTAFIRAARVSPQSRVGDSHEARNPHF